MSDCVSLCSTFIERINNSSGYDIFIAVLLGTIFTFIFSRSQISVTGFISLLIGVTVTYLWITSERIDSVKKEKEVDKDLDKLQKKMNHKVSFFDTKYKSVLYKNPDLVKVFINLCPFARFDTSNFKWSLVAANQLVKVYESAKIGHVVPNQTIDIAEQLQREVLNNMEALINSFPTTVIADYRFQSSINLLHKVLQNIVDNIKVIYNDYYEQNGPSIYDPPPSARAGPWANPLKAKDYNKYWNFFY